MSDEFERLDRLLAELRQVLEGPGEESEATAEESWQKLDVMYGSMGPDALGALLRRQGMGRGSVQAALEVLATRSGGSG